MVNTDRIVPITKIDYLSMIATAMVLTGTSFTVLPSSDVEGTFAVTGTGSAGNFLANQPVKTLDYPTGVTAATVYFVASNDFAGITVADAAATIDDAGLDIDDVKNDGITLYKAALASGEVTITAVTPSLS